MKKLSLAFVLLCCAMLTFAQNYTINAQLTGFPDKTKFYLKDLTIEADIDSAVIIGGKLIMKGKLQTNPADLWLYASYQKQFYYTVLLIGADKINITGDINQFPFNLKITGSKIQDLENELFTQTRDDYKQRNQLVSEYFTLNDSAQKVRGKAIWKTIGKIDNRDDSVRRAFIAKHLNSFAALNELTYLKNKYNHDTLQQMYNSLQSPYRESRFGKVIATYLKVGDPLKKGDNYVDITGQDRDGKQHKLSDIKNKYILVDFSETYCGPCMESVKTIRELQQQYADKLAVLTYSGDAGKKTWLQGVDRDKPEWLSIWDGTGYTGETSMKYGVTGYPTFFLIDPQGKIIASNVGYDPSTLKKTITDGVK